MRAVPLAIALAVTFVSSASAAPGETSFTPTSLLTPLKAVVLEGVNGTQPALLYHCEPLDSEQPSQPDAGMRGLDGGVGSVELDARSPASASDASAPQSCLVDMADPAALASLFAAAVDVAPGEYARVRFDHCLQRGDQGYTTYVRGSMTMNGSTWFTTHGGSQVLTNDPNEAREVALEHAGCSSSVPLPTTTMVVDGGELTISAIFSLRNITWATLTGGGPPGGCAFSAAHDQSVCTSYPIPVAYVGAVAPQLDVYYITEDLADATASKAGGQMLILKNAEGQAFGGFARRLYAPSSVQPSANYDTPIKQIATGAQPETYQIDTYGGGSSSGVPSEYYLRFPAFELRSHQGSFLRTDGPAVPYRAVKQ